MSRSIASSALWLVLVCAVTHAAAPSAAAGPGFAPPQARASAGPLDAKHLAGVQRIAARLLKAKHAEAPATADEQAVADSLKVLRARILATQAATLGGAPAVVPLTGAPEAKAAAARAAQAPGAKLVSDSIATLNARYDEFAGRRAQAAHPPRYEAMLQTVQAVKTELESLQALDAGTRAARLRELAQRLAPHKLSDEVAPMGEPTLSTITQHRAGPGPKKHR